jgi:ClpP class serine protease
MAKPSVSALVDELGELNEQLAEARKLNKRAEEIKAVLREKAAESKPEPNEGLTFHGKRYVATVGALPPRQALRYSIQQLFSRLGQKKFLSVCSVTIKALVENLEPSECADILVDDYGPTRPVTVQAK